MNNVLSNAPTSFQPDRWLVRNRVQRYANFQKPQNNLLYFYDFFSIIDCL